MALSFSTRIGDLNWLYLVEVIIIVIVVIFYLFYFGRLLGYFLSLGIRAYIWRKHQAWLDIGSIQFSPLGGRLLFREVRYVGQNQTIRIAMGHFTWRYWLWRVRRDDDLRKEDERLPCRLTVAVEGVEWFVYNRGPAFDLLLSKLGHREPKAGKVPTRNAHGKADKYDDAIRSTDSGPTESGSQIINDQDSGSIRILQPTSQPPKTDETDAIDWFRECLPIEVHIKNGAVVLGNRATPSLLIAGFKVGEGVCGAVPSRSRFDFYKQVYQFTFEQPKIVMRKNHDYEDPMPKHGARMKAHCEPLAAPRMQSISSFLSFKNFQDFLKSPSAFTDYVYNIRTERSDHKPEWKGLPRYRFVLGDLFDDKQNGTASDVQYGKFSTIYDAGKSIHLTYYADVAGFVPAPKDRNPISANADKPNIGNGDFSPEWGVDLRLEGGVLAYGPWSDRQRVALQHAFFPPNYFNTEATPTIGVGDRRLHGALKVYVDFDDKVVLRLPTREPSKDWKFDGTSRAAAVSMLQRRQYGWLDVTLGSGSSASIIVPMVAGQAGYEQMVEVHLDDLTVTSSVATDTFMTARMCRVSCQLPSPLIWDAPRTWSIRVQLDQMRCRMLREHTFLFTDVVRDFISGPPEQQQYFVPTRYIFDVSLTNFRLSLFLNERNIVFNANEDANNTLLHIGGPRLSLNVDVPALKYRPLYSSVSVQVETGEVELKMNPSAWNTHSAWKTQHTRSFAKLDRMSLSVLHTVYAEPRPDQVERLEIDISLDGVVFKMMGWVIKYLMSLKENYFGLFSHYVTLDDIHKADYDPNPYFTVDQKYRPGKADVFEVFLTLQSGRSIALLPQELYDCKTALVMDIPAFGVSLRNHDFAMELNVNFDTMSITASEDTTPILMTGVIETSQAEDAILINGLTVGSQRLFGSQPRTAVYVAAWEFAVGHIAGNLSVGYISALLRCGNAFANGFTDKDNALPDEYAIKPDPDLTLLTASVKEVSLSVWGEHSCGQITLSQGIAVKLDDRKTTKQLSNVSLTTPDVYLQGLIKCVPGDEWSEAVSLRTSTHVKVLTSGPADACEPQMRFLESQDASTARAAFLYSKPDDSARISKDFPISLCGLSTVLLEDGELHVSTGTSPDNQSRLGRHRIRQDFPQRQTRMRGARFLSESSVRSTSSRNPVYHPLLQCFIQRTDTGRYAAYDGPLFCSMGPASDIDAPHIGLTEKFPPQYPVDMPATSSDQRVQTLSVGIGPVTALASPMAMRLAFDVIATLDKTRDPERLLDTFEAKYKKLMVLRQLKQQPRSLRFCLRVALLDLRLVQDILQLDDSAGDQGSIRHSESQTGVVSVVNIKFRHLAASVGRDYSNSTVTLPKSSKALWSASLALRKAFMRIQHIVPAFDQSQQTVQGIPKAEPGVALEALATSLVCRLEGSETGSTGHAQLEESKLTFVQAASELVTGTVYTWFDLSRHIQKAVLYADYRQPDLDRLLLTGILQQAHISGRLDDPVFLGLPGIAQNTLRADFGWRVVAYTRHCLRNLEPLARKQLIASLEQPVLDLSETPQFDQLRHHLEIWTSTDISTEVLRKQAVVELAFPRLSRHRDPRSLVEPPVDETDSWTPHATVWWSQALVFRIRIIKFQTVFHSGYHIRNSLRLSDLQVGMLSRGMTTALPSVIASINLHSLDVKLDPSFISLVSHVGKVRRVFEARFRPILEKPHKSTAPEPTSLRPPDAAKQQIALRLFLYCHYIRVSTAAHQVAAGICLQQLSINTRLQMGMAADGVEINPFGDGNISVRTVEVEATSETAAAADENQVTTLLLWTIDKPNIAMRAPASIGENGGRSLSLTYTADNAQVRLPRSVLRMSQLYEYWQMDALPTTKLAFDELKRDLDLVPPVVASPITPSVPLRNWNIQFNTHVSAFAVHIRAARHFWLVYAVDKTTLYAMAAISGSDVHLRNAGVSIGSQKLSADGAPTAGTTAVSHSRGDLLVLPRLQMALDKPGATAAVVGSLDTVRTTITTDIIGTLTGAIVRFEKDLDEILLVVNKHKGKANVATADRDSGSAVVTCPWSVRAVLKGMQIGFKAAHSTQYIGTDVVKIALQNRAQAAPDPAGKVMDLVWDVSATELALSLVQDAAQTLVRSTGRRHALPSDQSARALAHFALDAHAGNTVLAVSELPPLAQAENASHLHVRVTKVHAVMHPAAIEHLESFFAHYTSEIASHKQAIKNELETIRSKLASALPVNEKPKPHVRPWLERCVLSIRFSNIGIAVPLTSLELQAPQSQSSVTVAQQSAFLLSAKHITFATAKGSDNFAKIDTLRAQFLRQFDQNNYAHFDGTTHHSQNRVTSAVVEATLARHPSSGTALQSYRLTAAMSGIAIDVDANVIGFAGRLADLYDDGYQRILRYAPMAEQDHVTSHERTASRNSSGITQEAGHQASFIDTTTFEASFSIAEGTIDLHKVPNDAYNQQDSRVYSKYSSLSNSLSRNRTGNKRLDRFTIPPFSAWAVKRNAGEDDARHLVHVDTVIHASSNTLYPTLLPIMEELAFALRERIRVRPSVKATEAATSKDTMPVTPMSSQIAARQQDREDSGLHRLLLTLSLRIEESRLALSCDPLQPTKANLDWQSGGLLLRFHPDTRKMQAAFSVDKIAFTINHALSNAQDYFVDGKAEQLVLNYTYAPAADSYTSAIDSITAEIASVEGTVLAPKIDKWIAFKTVWVDRMSNLRTTASERDYVKAVASVNAPVNAPVGAKFMLRRLALLRTRSLSFTCHLGEANNKIVITVEDFMSRAILVPDSYRLASLSLSRLHLKLAGGDVVGDFDLAGFSLQTRSLDLDAVQAARGKTVIELLLSTGQLISEVSAYTGARLLLVTADPVRIYASDDWTKAAEQALVSLNFRADLRQVGVIITAETAPILSAYSLKILAETVASAARGREAIASLMRLHDDIQPGVPLITASAPDNLVEEPLNYPIGEVNENCSGHRILGRLQMHVATLRMTLFRDDIGKLPLGHNIIFTSIDIDLRRSVDDDGTTKRDIELAWTRLDTRQLHDVDSTAASKAVTASDWIRLLAATKDDEIVTYPATTVSMRSSQKSPGRIVEHSFRLDQTGFFTFTTHPKTLGHLVKTGQNWQRKLDDASRPAVRASGSKAAQAAAAAVTDERVKEISRPADLLPESAISGDITFVPKEIILNMAEMTRVGLEPPYEVMGLKRALLPAFTHNLVTVHVERLLLELTDLYQRTLKKIN